MAWYFNCPGGASLKITNPVGFDVTALYTQIIVVRPISTATDGRSLVKLGDPDSGQGTGIALGFTGAEKPRHLLSTNEYHEHATTLSMGTWYRMAAHSAGSGVAQRGVTVNGTKTTQSIDPPADLIAGDQLSIAYGVSVPSWGAPDVEVAMMAWLHNNNLSGADVEAYANDPCALLPLFGPGGTEDPDALSLLLLGDLTVDLSGKGNHPTIVGGEWVDGPTDYPVACAVLEREQEGFRWRADDGSESAASWLAAQDTNISRAVDVNTRIRYLTDITGGDPPPEGVKQQWRKVGDPDTEWRDVL